MHNEVRLFINEEEIEFSRDPDILLNFKETELRMPTVVRNSFTKQIQVEGTNRNNDIFGHIWDLTRIQDGMYFNPIQKTDFQLFINGELFERGYCKLDKVTRTNNTIQYSITLYGGLGSFFYNLSYDQSDNSNAKKTLASLTYSTYDRIEPSLDFKINKENVYEAWGQITGVGTVSNDRWNVINFVPALNGIPSDFDASKVLINNSVSLNWFETAKTVDGATYRPVLNGNINSNGFSLGEVNGDLQEWQTRDLRSYNQRPAISMYRIIQACCQPENNGGYEVILDKHFFNTTNPYYFDSWVTLPMLRDMDGMGGGETHEIASAEIVKQTGTYYYNVDFDSTLSSINNVNLNVNVHFTPESATTATELYGDRYYRSRNVTTLNGWEYVKKFNYNTGIICQMLAYGENGDVVAQSKAYYLGGKKNYPGSNDAMWKYFYKNGDPGVQPEYVFLDGYWKLIGGNYVFVNRSGKIENINFSFSAPNDFTTLVLKVKQPGGLKVNYFFIGTQETQIADITNPSLYAAREYNTTGRHSLEEALDTQRVPGQFSFVITDMNATVTDYEGLFSDTLITKDRLLTTENSPADYLLSYCKLFGLYFYYDSTEASSDPERYPSGVVHIMDRDTFYTDEVVDLSQMVDWNRTIEITPAMASSKWYKFDTEHIDSELETGYKEQYGRDYGSQLVNTNYNFDASTTNLYDGNVFKNGIMALEKDKYYKKDGSGLPVYQYGGLTYNLYRRSGTELEATEIDFTPRTTMSMESINSDYEFFNAFPMLQAHGNNNDPSDGSNVLLFLKGSVGPTNANYWITDDLPEMVTLNDASPCWILTWNDVDGGGNEIAKRVNYFPYFTRDIVPFGIYGNIVHSWNFGHPQVIYSPDTYTTDGDSIYDKCWKNYIGDMYSVDTRKLTCYVRAQFDGKPWPYWLRRFYWFENSLWRMNAITDLNLGSFDTTKMEFIKVQDIDNYKLNQILYQGNNYVELDQDTVPCTGGTITGTVYLQGAGGWFAADVIGGTDEDGNRYTLEAEDCMVPLSHRGDSASTFTVTMPANTGNSPIDWVIRIEDDLDKTYPAPFTQEACVITPPTMQQFGSRTFPSTGGDIYFVVQTDYDIVFRSVPDWITILDETGGTYTEGQRIAAANANRTFVLRAPANEGAARSVGATFNMGWYVNDVLQRQVFYFSFTQNAG